MKCKISICSSGLIIWTYAISGVALSSCFLPSDFLPEAIAQTLLLAQSSGTNYGLGLPKTASTGGGTRLVNPDNPVQKVFGRARSIPIIPNSEPPLRGGVPSDRVRQPSLMRKPQLPLLILITPEDGARTASPQPTFYWHLYEQNTQQSQAAIDNLADDTNNNKDNFVGQISITTIEESKTISIFQTSLKMRSGLSSFKLPIAASLQPSKTYRWQITVQDQEKKEVTASGWIVYTPPDDSLQKLLMRALTLRDRAKIYAEAGYWFEAIDGYTRWLKLSPKDLKARTARNEILKVGLFNNQNLNFNVFMEILNAGVPK